MYGEVSLNEPAFVGEIDDESHLTLSTNSTAIVSTVDDSMISLHLTIPPKTNDKRLAVGTNQLRLKYSIFIQYLVTCNGYQS